MAIILECMRLVQCQTVAALPMGVQVGQRSKPAAVTPFVTSVTPVVLRHCHLQCCVLLCEFVRCCLCQRINSSHYTHSNIP